MRKQLNYVENVQRKYLLNENTSYREHSPKMNVKKKKILFDKQVWREVITIRTTLKKSLEVQISWQIDGERMETVTDLIFLGPKITVDGDCSHEIKRRLLIGRKAMINLDSVLKSRDITLLTKICLVKAMVFPVVMYGCES